MLFGELCATRDGGAGSSPADLLLLFDRARSALPALRAAAICPSRLMAERVIGMLSLWNRAKGCGFLRVGGSQRRVFLHVSSPGRRS